MGIKSKQRMKTLILLIAVFQAKWAANGNTVPQEVALVIGEKTIDDCTFTIIKDCKGRHKGTQQDTSTVNEKNYKSKIDPGCTITEITSECNILQQPANATCACVTNPPPPPTGRNYVFEFHTNMEGCILIQK